MRRNLIVIAGVLALGVSALVAGSAAAEEKAVMKHHTWSFSGPFGTLIEKNSSWSS